MESPRLSINSVPTKMSLKLPERGLPRLPERMSPRLPERISPRLLERVSPRIRSVSPENLRPDSGSSPVPLERPQTLYPPTMILTILLTLTASQTEFVM
jgi:hypothetical protein